MVVENEQSTEQPHEGYIVAPTLHRTDSGDGKPLYTCVLTATTADDATARPLFERTLELSEDQAAITNRWRPGAIPTREQLDGEMLDIGVAYMHTLIELINRSGQPIASTATLSLGLARSRIGMSAVALAARER